MEMEETKDGSYLLHQYIKLKELIDYITQKKGRSAIPEDNKDYLDYNCAMCLPYKVEGYPVYFITNDVGHT